MEEKKYYNYCIYTIKHSQDIEKSLLTTRDGIFNEKNRWTKAKKMLEDARLNNQDLIVVFAPAEKTLFLHSWAILTHVNIGKDKSTEYSFKNLTKIIEYENGVSKSELLLKSTGKNINENFIIPYALCRTPYDIIENYSMDIEEFEAIYEETHFEMVPDKQETGKRL